MTRKEAAAYLRVSERFLAQPHPGLKVVKLGRRRLYRRGDLDAWLEQCTREQATDAGGAPLSRPASTRTVIELTQEARELADALRRLESQRGMGELDRNVVSASQRRAKKS